MKVLLTHDRFPPVFGGGGEYVVLETAKGLLRCGIDLTVLAGGDPKITSYEGIAANRIPVPPARFSLAVAQIVKQARAVDLIQTFTYYAALPSLAAGRLTGKPVVVYVLGIYGDAWRAVRPPMEARMRIAFEKFLVRRKYSQMIVPSSRTRDLAVSMGADPRRLSVSNPGISSHLRPRTKENYVFFSGKTDKRKGTEDLLFVARALPHVRFRAMVWGPEVQALKNAAPPNIEFPPFERGETLWREFGAARIFFFPSVSETFSIAMTEAMASGCAIVASQVATVDVPFEGVRVRPGDRTDMAAGIDRLWKDPALCASLGDANARLARQYGWGPFIERLRNVYQQVLEGGGRAQIANRHTVRPAAVADPRIAGRDELSDLGAGR